jgi:hypothetical protein
MAEPLRFTICGLTEESSVTATEPDTVPGARGLKTTVNVQEAPADTEPLQGLMPPGAAEKSPLAVIPLMVTVLALTLLALTLLVTLVVPTMVFAKDRVATEKESGLVLPFTPTPVSPIRPGLKAPL